MGSSISQQGRAGTPAKPLPHPTCRGTAHPTFKRCKVGGTGAATPLVPIESNLTPPAL